MVQQILARSLATMVIIRFSPCVNVSCPLVQSSLAEEACLPLYGLLWHDFCSPPAITRKTCLFSSDSSKAFVLESLWYGIKIYPHNTDNSQTSWFSSQRQCCHTNLLFVLCKIILVRKSFKLAPGVLNLNLESNLCQNVTAAGQNQRVQQC